MSFHHPAHYNYRGFTILQSGAICAAATLIGQIFPKVWEDICSPVKEYWSIAQSRVLLCENGCVKTQFHLNCVFCLDGTGVWKMWKNLWNVVRSKKKSHTNIEHAFFYVIISLCCTVTPIYASLNTNAPLHTVTVFCYCEGKHLYFLQWFGFDLFICQSIQSYWTHQL